MKSLMLLWKEAANEFAARCCTSATMDCKTVQGRFEHEGLSFLTITLPTFGKDLQKGLDQGYVDRSLFQGFSWTAGLPRLFGGFLDRVFDRSSGVLLDEPDDESIYAVRELTLMFNKLALPCTPVRERKAFSDFVQCEQEVKEFDASLTKSMRMDFKRVAMLLFQDAFTNIDRDIYEGACIPKHGPGATADKFRGNGKYRQTTWTVRLDKIFPSSEYLIPSPSYYEELERVDLLEPDMERPVRVISVPKTLKTPRIIAVEPTAMQYAQQGVLEVILNHLDRDDILSKVIGFDDQVPNQELAREGSLFGELATLDLSEASDRVSNQLVREMVSNYKWLTQALDATRSRKADVPGHGVLRLSKFASMGSALCFPVEAMVFTTLIFMGIEQTLRTPLSRAHINEYSDKVRVYGDDIICPVDTVPSVVSMLETFGFRVNADKSFWTGKFRESCGKDYYNGTDVSVVRVREVLPTHRKHATGIISAVSLRNQLYHAGLWQTCRWMDDYIQSVIKHFPVVEPSSPVLGRHSYLGHETHRMHEHYHSPLVKGYVVSSRVPSDPLEGSGALLKFFLKRGGQPSVDRRHLERAGRPHAVDIKLRWASSI